MTRPANAEGLRERKKQAMRRYLRAVALRLFAVRGFDAVTVAEVAEVAEVSTKTVFNYFPVKEDLVLGGREELDDDLVEVIRVRAAGESILDAVRRHTLEAAQRMHRYPPRQMTAFRKVVAATPSVQTRWRELSRQQEAELARLLAQETGAPPDDVVPALVAGQLAAVSRLAYCDIAGWPGGRRRTLPKTRDAVERAVRLLQAGLADYGRRRVGPAARHGAARSRKAAARGGRVT